MCAVGVAKQPRIHVAFPHVAAFVNPLVATLVSFRNSWGPLASPWAHSGLGGASPAQVWRKFVHTCGTVDLQVFGKHGVRRVGASLVQVLAQVRNCTAPPNATGMPNESQFSAALRVPERS
jgi:hypothetical protein